jgi:hypothetical protein
MIKLGSKVEDVITGFTGIATERIVYLYGCVHILVQPQELDKNGEVKKIQHFDEQRLKVKNSKLLVLSEVKETDVECGDRVEDIVTGFKGIVTSLTYTFDNIFVAIESEKISDNGEMLPYLNVVAKRIKIIKKAKPVVSKDSSAESGGPDPRNLVTSNRR